jgi:DNA-directed RNA polymerase subunit RPC12/RpoP
MSTAADMYVQQGMVNTPLYCHSCDKNFIARIDFDVDGNHAVECPHCGHLHYRVIQNGKVTSDRYSSDHRTVTIEKRNVWKHNDLAMQTSSVSHFLRDRWLNCGT